MQKLLVCCCFFFSFCFYYDQRIFLVNKKNPFFFYSSEKVHFDQLFSKIVSSTKHRLRLYSYGTVADLTYENLRMKPLQIVEHTDPYLFHIEKGHLYLPKHTKGLMHKKAIISDDKSIYVGSTNLTESSLYMHHNIIVGLYHRKLVQAFEEEKPYLGKKIRFYPLPRYAKTALDHLLDLLKRAQRRIDIAMFALSHPQLIEELIGAHQRGIKVRIFLDKSNFRHQGRLEKLQKAQVPMLSSQSKRLLHEKMALIDQTFVFGSVNWTRNGFMKNEESLFILTGKDLRPIENCFASLAKECYIW